MRVTHSGRILMIDEIKIDEHDGVLAVTVNRPGKRNALTSEMYEALSQAFQYARSTRSVRAVRIGGTGGTFTAGNDLGDFLKRPPLEDDAPVARFLRCLVDFNKPLVAAVSGHAVGIGSTMILHCDLVYADETALFQFPFVNLGLVPEAASSLLLPAFVGRRAAAELMMLGDFINAHQAERIGLVTKTVAPDALEETVRIQLAKLVALPAEALALTKQLLNRPAETLRDRLRAESRLFGERLGSAEVQEALTAFAEKRKPDFRRV